jgi:hypothetical protein
MFYTIQDLKVDQTVLPSENRGIFVSNINIPVSELDNLNNVVARAQQLIHTDYVDVPLIQYQVCATYQLRNIKTGDTRQWAGSFNPRGNQNNTLSQFVVYNPGTFAANVINASSQDNIFARLRFYHVQTNWVFDRLTSIIICIQAVVNLTHPTLIQRGLLVLRHGNRRRRNVYSFLLP